MRKRALLGLAMVLLAGVASGCSRKIEGAVKDPFGKPIPDATVQIENTQFLASTGENGRYELDYAPGQFTILFSKDGYVGESRQISIAEKEEIPFEDVLLYPVPAEQGLFMVGESDYVKLEPSDIDRQAKANFWGYGKATYRVPEWALDYAPIVFSGNLTFVDRYPDTVVLAELSDGIIRRATEGLGFEGGQVDHDGFREDRSRKVDTAGLALRSVEIAPGDYAWVELERGPFGASIGRRAFAFRVRSSSAEREGEIEVERIGADNKRNASLDLVNAGVPVTASKDFRLLQGQKPISLPLLYEDKKPPQKIEWVSRSRSGKRLLLAVCDFDCDDLRVVDLGASEIRRIATWKYTDFDWVSWSPSERYIVLSSSHVDSVLLYAYDVTSLDRFDLDYSIMASAADADPQSDRASVKWIDENKFSFSLPVVRQGKSVKRYDVTVDLFAGKLSYKRTEEG